MPSVHELIDYLVCHKSARSGGLKHEAEVVRSVSEIAELVREQRVT